MTRAPRLLLAAIATITALTLGTTLGAGSPAGATGGADPGDAKPPAADTAPARQALAALARVESLFSPAAARRSSTADRPDVTLALRDLALLVDDLPADRRAEARTYFRRPTQPGGDATLAYGNATVRRVCGGIVCVHYATTGIHRPNLTDDSGNGVPDYVDTALATLREVNDTYVAAGYKRPRGDGGVGGGTNMVDVYLGDIDRDGSGIYGYCTTDEQTTRQTYGRWAYCVLDDDYANIRGNPLDNLRVTAAHEYFHAVQYAYDFVEDAWFLEATATWVEDEMFDDVNDNEQYLRNSPISNPRRPMDQFQGLWHYGVWIFFRYLTERFPAEQGGLPTIVRDMWRLADGSTRRSPDLYSWQAVNRVLSARGTSAAAQFTAFSVGNRRPTDTYAEGAELGYPSAPLWTRVTLTGSQRSATRALPLSHLSSATARFTPSGFSSSAWKLRVRFDLPPTTRGSRAVVVVTTTSGVVRTFPVRLDRTGAGTSTVSFSDGSVRHVEATIVNASARFRCWRRTKYSCSGTPLDDRLRQQVTATAFR